MDFSKIANYLRSKSANALNPSQPESTDLGDLAVDIGGSFVPGVGQAMALRDFNRAREENDMLGMGLSALGAIPGVGGAIKGGRKIFGGIRGAANDPEKIEALAKARELRASGTEKREIWEKTGWAGTPEAKPMFEISDQHAVLKGAALEHPELFQRYPELANVKIQYKDMSPSVHGEFDPAAGIITLNKNKSSKDQLKTVLHEFQHAVDKIETRSAGSNKEMGQKLADELRTAVRSESSLKAAKEAKALIAQGLPPKEAMDFVVENAPGPVNNRMLEKFTMASPQDVDDELRLAMSQVEELRKANVTTSMEANYFGNIGEARARAVEARRRMDPAQRRLIHPEDTMEYSMSEPIEIAKQLRRY